MPDTSTQLRAPTISAAKIVARHLRRTMGAGELAVPMLPEVATRVMTMARADDSSAASLSGLIQRDVGLAGHMIRMANSAAYSLRSPVVSLQQAIAWLGIDEVAQIAFSLAVRSKVFDAPRHKKAMRDLWRQSLASGLWARDIARIGRRNVETAYLCGLLHDIGRPVALHCLDQAARESSVELDEEDFRALLDEYAGPVTRRVVDEWDLPDMVRDVINDWCDDEPEGEHATIALTVRCAHRFAEFTLGTTGTTREELCELPSLGKLNLYPDEVGTLLDQSARILATVRAN